MTDLAANRRSILAEISDLLDKGFVVVSTNKLNQCPFQVEHFSPIEGGGGQFEDQVIFEITLRRKGRYLSEEEFQAELTALEEADRD